jgi:hypothetical protein
VENINNDELEIEHCYESCDDNVVQEISLRRDEVPNSKEDAGKHIYY